MSFSGVAMFPEYNLIVTDMLSCETKYIYIYIIFQEEKHVHCGTSQGCHLSTQHFMVGSQCQLSLNKSH